MITKLLASYCPEPHPLKLILERKRAPQWLVARFLGCSQGHLSHILNGIRAASPEMEEKLATLAAEEDC